MTSLRELLLGLGADVERLLGAGATAARGDERLQRRAALIEECARHVPALVPVVTTLGRVLEPAASQSGGALLDLLLTVRLTTATVAGSDLDGTLEPAGDESCWTTTAATRTVYRVVHALDHPSIDGRELLDRVLANGQALDLRLVDRWLGFTPQRCGHSRRFLEVARPAAGKALVAEAANRLNLSGRRAACQLFHLICTLDPSAALECCRKAVREGSPMLRAKALRHLGALAPAEAEAVARTVLGQPHEPEVRAAGFRVLQWSVDAPELLRLLQHHLTDADAWKVCRTARPVLRALGPAGVRLALSHFLPLLRGGTSQSRRDGAKALGALGAMAESAVPDLLAVLQAGYYWDGIDVMRGLARIGRPGPTILTALFEFEQRWYSSPAMFHRAFNRRLVDNLQAIIRRDPSALATLAARVSKPGFGFRSEVAELLGRFCRGTREMAFSTLHACGAAAVDSLIEMARTSNREVRHGALRTLGRIGPLARAALPLLRDAMRDSRLQTRAVAAAGLLGIKADTGKAVAVLAKIVGTHRYRTDVRCEAVRALAGIRWRAVAALPVLNEVRAHHGNPQLRAAAAEAIEAITPRSWRRR